MFSHFSWDEFRDSDLILRSVPVTASLGALGKGFYDEDPAAQSEAIEVLTDSSISWEKGPHWTGVAGKTNPTTGRFAVGGGKEYAYATYRALSDEDSAEGEQIRGAVPEAV